MSVCMRLIDHHNGSHPCQPSRCFLYSIAPFLESLHPYLNHHFFRHHGAGCCRYWTTIFWSSWGGAAAPPPPPTPPLLFRLFAPNWIITFSIIMGLPPPPPGYFLDILQGLGCRRPLGLLVMLGMLAGHAGDVENDADDVDGHVHFVRKCCSY